MPAAPVVLNNTPLVGLWLLNRLDLVQVLFGEALIPSGVYAEFVALEGSDREHCLNLAPWIQVRPIQDERRVLTYAGLDRGEAEVLALAEEVGARLVVLDERKGRRFAERLAHLQNQGFHLHGRLVEKALQLAQE